MASIHGWNAATMSLSTHAPTDLRMSHALSTASWNQPTCWYASYSPNAIAAMASTITPTTFASMAADSRNHAPASDLTAGIRRMIQPSSFNATHAAVAALIAHWRTAIPVIAAL